MAYGYQGFREEELVFPQLMPAEQVERMIDASQAARAPERPTFRPIGVIRAHAPALARELEVLWGYRGFGIYVEGITRPGAKAGPLPADQLEALLALADYHSRALAEGREPGDISLRLVRATPAAS